VPLTRREFVKGGIAGTTLAYLSPQLLATTTPTAPKSLVVLQLMGGNDTINTFIPYSDPLYRAARPTIGIPDAKILQVDSRFGFHPSMPELADLYRQGKFAFIPNIGFPSLDRSHFRCADVWQTASEDPNSQPRGWVGRWADMYVGDPYSPAATVAVTDERPRGVASDRVQPTCILDLDSFAVHSQSGDPDGTTAFASSLRRIYGLTRSDATVETIRQQGNGTFQAIDLFHALPSPAQAGYPSDSLGSAFQFAAQLIAANYGTNVVWITLGSFDTHAMQVTPGSPVTGNHADLWRDVSGSLSAFQRDIETRGIADRVLVVGWSEFGRRVSENASYGTDHGKAGSAMILGTRVRGGQWYGDPYDLSDLDDGDLKTRIDFRSIYATVIRDWLGGDDAAVLGGQYEQLGFVMPSRRRAVGR
jgi:uncharacterized protein (DUF1501 family)